MRALTVLSAAMAMLLPIGAVAAQRLSTADAADILARSAAELMSCRENEAGGRDCRLLGAGMAISARIESFDAGVAQVALSFLSAAARG